jgi:hypothetical protein
VPFGDKNSSQESMSAVDVKQQWAAQPNMAQYVLCARDEESIRNKISLVGVDQL